MAEPRVLFFSTSYPSSPTDRAGPFVHALARSLVRQGISVRVLAPAFGSDHGVSHIDGVEVHRFRFAPARWQTLTMGFGGVPVAMRRKPWTLLQLPLLLAAAAALCTRAAATADILHAHWLPNLLPLMPGARLRRRPRVVTLWGSDVEWFERSPRLRPAFRALLRGADGIVAINAHMRELFSPGTKPGQVRLIPSGVDTELFYPRDRGTLRDQLGLPRDRVIALAAGSLIPRKGVDVAIEAVAQLGDDRLMLLVVGEGQERARLLQLCEQRGLGERVRFAGGSDLAGVAAFMAAADIFVLPSHYEGRPNVVLEAQASGLAVVASDIPGCRDLIESGVTGLLAPPGDPVALADTLADLVDDASLRSRLGGRANTAIHDHGYTWDACAQLYGQLYRDLWKA